MEPCPGIGRMCNARFVPHIDDANSLSRRHCQHFVQMIAHERKDVPYPKLADCLDEQLGAGWHRYRAPFPLTTTLVGRPSRKFHTLSIDSLRPASSASGVTPAE